MSDARPPLDEARARRIREERDIAAEFEAHVAHRVDDLVAQGVSEEAARARARAEFGDAGRLKDESRAARATAPRATGAASAFDVVGQDIAYSLRRFRRAPGFTLAAIATLMLGIGAATTIVSVVDAVVLEPLPFESPDRLVFAEMVTPAGDRFSVAEPAFLDWRERASSLSDMAALDQVAATLRSPGQPRSVTVTRASHSLLDVLGVSPLMGRMFNADEDRSGQEASVTLLSSGMWRSDFGADPEVLGKRLDLDGISYEIIGVMPPTIDLLTDGTPVFVPMGPDPGMDRGEHYLSVVARLSDGILMEDALAELEGIQRVLGQTYAVEQEWSATLLTSDAELIGESTERAGWILLAAAALLLLTACANVSNLLVVRATARREEIGVRTALGATRGRIVRQLMTESVSLAFLGGAAGVALAYVLVPLVKASGEGRIPRLESAQIDGTALVALLLSIAISGWVCALAPLLQVRSEAATAVRSSRRGSSERNPRLRSFLVAAQLAMTVVLLAGTGLLARSFLALTRVDPGFEAEGTLAVILEMPDQTFSWEERGNLVPRIREAVASLPGVSAVGATAVDPFSGLNLANFVARVDRLPDRAADFTPISWRSVTPGFFEAMGMRLEAGRTFEPTDSWDGGTPIVIGEGLASTLFGEESAVGRTLVWGDPGGSRMRVIGVVGDLRDVSLDEDPFPIVYRPHRQIPWAVMTLVARVQGDPALVAAGIRGRIQEAVPGLPVGDIRSLEENLHAAVAEPRFNLRLLASFAVVGLLLALIGVYGVTAFDVRRRFREIGIRLSLGAEPAEIRRMIIRQRLHLTSAGVAAGLAAAWLLTSWIESQLYGIGRSDPLTWLVVLSVVVATSTVATYVPARQATRVQPRDVLNGE